MRLSRRYTAFVLALFRYYFARSQWLIVSDSDWECTRQLSAHHCTVCTHKCTANQAWSEECVCCVLSAYSYVNWQPKNIEALDKLSFMRNVCCYVTENTCAFHNDSQPYSICYGWNGVQIFTHWVEVRDIPNESSAFSPCYNRALFTNLTITFFFRFVSVPFTFL